MATTIAKHYSEELVDWNDSINFNNAEMEVIEQKLLDVIRRNSIIGIAEKVNAHQTRLNRVADMFDEIREEIQNQEAELKTDGTLLDDSFIHYETEKQQAELRRKMQEAEKEYIDVKFDCFNFLSETLK